KQLERLKNHIKPQKSPFYPKAKKDEEKLHLNFKFMNNVGYNYSLLKKTFEMIFEIRFYCNL
ncbi:MAG: hypothetical protein RLZZ414_914, partial [Bacteroidota bacterium]